MLCEEFVETGKIRIAPCDSLFFGEIGRWMGGWKCGGSGSGSGSGGRGGGGAGERFDFENVDRISSSSRINPFLCGNNPY